MLIYSFQMEEVYIFFSSVHFENHLPFASLALWKNVVEKCLPGRVWASGQCRSLMHNFSSRNYQILLVSFLMQNVSIKLLSRYNSDGRTSRSSQETLVFDSQLGHFFAMFVCVFILRFMTFHIVTKINNKLKLVKISLLISFLEIT